MEEKIIEVIERQFSSIECNSCKHQGEKYYCEGCGIGSLDSFYECSKKNAENVAKEIIEVLNALNN